MNSLNKSVIAILIFVIGVGGFFFFRSSKSQSGEEPGIGRVERRDLLQRVTIAGAIVPLRRTVITAPYNGYVKKLFVKVGDKVKMGDPIVSVVQSLVAGDEVFPLRSPLNGTVVQIERSEGEYVKEGDETNFILRIDDTDKLFVVSDAPEIDRVKVKAGQVAVIKASAILNRTYNGIIQELSLAARSKDRWSRSQVVEFPIKIEVTDPDPQLRPGMSVVLDVITEKREKVLTLRHEFIRRDESDQYYVVLADGERRNIKVGIQNEEGFEILEGLTEKDRIQQVDFAAMSSEG